MAIYKSDIADINLETGSILRSFMKHTIGTADQAADRIGVRAFRDGVPEDLSGASVYGYFRNSNGDNIALTSYGTVDGNVAYVTLPQACYNYEGNFTLTIKLLVTGVTSTVRIVDGVVDNTNTGSAVAPTSAVPTYSEILSQYDDMVAATAVANGAIATTFNAATVYPAGSYVINSGALYLITADHAANVTWANTSKVATTIGAEVSSLKSAIILNADRQNEENVTLETALKKHTAVNMFNPAKVTTGKTIQNDGTIADNVTQMLTDFMPAVYGDIIYLTVINSSGDFFSINTAKMPKIAVYDGAYTFIGIAANVNSYEITYNSARYIRLSISSNWVSPYHRR